MCMVLYVRVFDGVSACCVGRCVCVSPVNVCYSHCHTNRPNADKNCCILCEEKNNQYTNTEKPKFYTAIKVKINQSA
jgi:hypothetical protein